MRARRTAVEAVLGGGSMLKSHMRANGFKEQNALNNFGDEHDAEAVEKEEVGSDDGGGVVKVKTEGVFAEDFTDEVDIKEDTKEESIDPAITRDVEAIGGNEEAAACNEAKDEILVAHVDTSVALGSGSAPNGDDTADKDDATSPPATGRSASTSTPRPPASRGARQKHPRTRLVESAEAEPNLLRPYEMEPVPVTVKNHWVYIFFRFCVERHKMHGLRQSGVPRDALTEDATMKSIHVGNVFRQIDPSSMNMSKEIIGLTPVRVFLYTQFYNPKTWAALCKVATGGWPSWKHYQQDLPNFEARLHSLTAEQDQKIYYGGFQLVPPTVYFDYTNNRNRDKTIKNYQASLRLVLAMMEAGLPTQLAACTYAVDASNVLQTIPTLGGFLSLNILCYLNDSTNFKWLYRDFATCGPGSAKYLQRIFGEKVINSLDMQSAGLRWLFDNQWRYYARLDVDPLHEWETAGLKPGLRVLDIENALCWCHRYVAAYLKNGTPSVADIPMPEYDPSLTEDAGPPAWCVEEKWVESTSIPAYLGTKDQRLAAVEEGLYEVERVVGRNGGRFKVRWKGYPPEEDTWETEAQLREGSGEVLDEWLEWEGRVRGAIERIKVEMKPVVFEVKRERAEGRPPKRVKRESPVVATVMTRPRVKSEPEAAPPPAPRPRRPVPVVVIEAPRSLKRGSLRKPIPVALEPPDRRSSRRISVR